MKASPLKKARPPGAAASIWNLWLYIAGPTTKSVTAFRNLERICEEHLGGRYHIQVVDLVENPQIACDNQILSVPTVMRKQPSPMRRILGDLSDTKRALDGLDLPLHDPSLFTPQKSRP